MSALLACPSSAQKVKLCLIENVLDHRSIRHVEVDPGVKVLDCIPESWRSEQNLVVACNGAGLCGDQLARATLPGDELTIYVVPGDPASIITSLVVGLILAGVSYGITALTAPSARTSRSELDESGTYGFDGIVNTVRPGTRIPIIYGTHRFGGHIIQQFLRQATRAEENKDEVDVGELHTLIGLCAGPIESVDSVRLDGNPITDFQDVEWESRLGAFSQSAIDGFHDVRIQRGKDVVLRQVDGPSTFTMDSEADAFEIIFRFLGGLFKTNSGGGFSKKTVNIEIEYREVGAIQWIFAGRKTITAKRQNPVEAWFRSEPLERARYEIRVTRITPDDNTATERSEVNVVAVNEILDESLAYPGLALLGLRQIPNNQFSGRAPTVDALLKGRIVRVYSDASTYVEQWSDNPAWCTLDLMTDKVWGLGKWFPREKILIDTFLEWAAACNTLVAKDSSGTLEKQFTLNIVLDGSLTAIDAIKQLCATGRAVPVKRGDKWGVRFLKAESPIQAFTMGRINKGSFRAIRQGRADAANVVSAQFWNAELNYEQDFLLIPDQTVNPGEEQVESTVNLLGTTSLSQANRILNHFMLTNRLERRRAELEVGVEALAVEPGDVFKVAHDVPGWGFSGKLVAVNATGTQLTLDREVTIESGKTYEVTAIHASDVIDVVGVTSNPGTTRVINVTGDWSSPPVVGLDYSFGELNRSTVLYRCRSITKGSSFLRRKIAAIEYDPAVFGTDLTVLPQPSLSRLQDPDRIPAPVTNLRAFERIFSAIDGTLSLGIDVHFTLPFEGGVRALVYWRELGTVLWGGADNAVDVGRYTIRDPDLQTGATYEISVVTVSSSGRRRGAEQGERVTVATLGSTRQPQKVSEFRGDRTVTGLIFSWAALDPTINYDLDFYELRVGTAWETAEYIGQTRDTTLATSVLVKGEQTFLIKGRNSLGNYSAEAAAIVLEVEGRLGENIILTQQEETAWTGAKQHFTVSSGKLVLVPSQTSVGWIAAPQEPSLGGGIIPGGRGTIYLLTGVYTTAAFEVTTGNAVRSLVSADLVVDQVDSSAYWTAPGVGTESWTSAYGQARAWAVAPEGRVRWRVEMRFSTTDSADSSFGPWQVRAQNIEVAVKWAQARLIVEIADPAFSVEVPKFQILFDVPEYTTSGSVTTSAAGTVAVTYPTTFNQAPKVAATVIGASPGDEIFITNKTTSGFDLEVKNAGSRVVRTVNWVASGY